MNKELTQVYAGTCVFDDKDYAEHHLSRLSCSNNWSVKQVSVEPVVSVNFEEETYKIIIAGNKLAEAAHKVQSDYDGIHRLRLALAEWYRTRANEFNRDNKISD